MNGLEFYMTAGIYLKSKCSVKIWSDGFIQYDTSCIKFKSIQDNIIMKFEVMLVNDKHLSQDHHFLWRGRRVESDMGGFAFI